MSKINEIASDAAFALIDQLTAELRSEAAAADWPEEIVSQLSITWDGNNLAVAYPPEIASTVENLEYGSFSDKPNSVIRGFIYRCVPIVQNVFMNRTMPLLMDAEGLFA